MERHAPATRLTFISHAATAAQRRAAFSLDEELGEAASAKIASLGWIAPRTQQVFSGPELRTRQTAEALGLAPATATGLRDCDYGRWAGLELGDVQLHEPDNMMAWLTDPAAAPHGGESVKDLVARVGRWLDEQREAGHTLAITHPAVIRAAVVYALDAPLQLFWRIDVSPLSLTDLRFTGRVWTLRLLGCAVQGSMPRE